MTLQNESSHQPVQKVSIVVAALAAVAALLVLNTLTSGTPKPPLFLINTTFSLPLGFYLRSPKPPLVGSLIAFYSKVGTEFSPLAPRPRLLLKPVVAGAGVFVCVRNRRVFIGGRAIALALDKDTVGRPLRAWQGCRPLERDELFVISNYSERSFDSRYFGPIRRGVVVGTYTPAAVI